MDKIYSRTRIKIPKINKKKLRVLGCAAVAVLTFVILMKSFSPTFDELCSQKATELALRVVNNKSSDVFDKYECNEIMQITEGENRDVKINVSLINKISSELSNEMDEELQNIKNEVIEIPLGTLLGNKYLAGIGPKIKIRVNSVGSVSTEIKTEFVEEGINQTLYKIYIEVKCPITILTAYKNIEEIVEGKILLVETVIVGDVPQTYYNLEKTEKNQ